MTNQDTGGEWGDGNFTILPEGYYKAFVKNAEAKFSKNGNKMVTLTLNVEHDEYDGVTIYHHLVFMPDANNFNNKKRQWFQISAGIPYNLLDDNGNVAKLILNRKLTIKVKTGQNRDGKDQNEICGVHPYNWNDSSANANANASSDAIPPSDGLDDEFL
jgi:hypothetical protein